MTINEAIIDIRENIKPVVGGKSLDIALDVLENHANNDWIPCSSGKMPENDYDTVLAVAKQDDGYYYYMAVYTKEHGFRTEDFWGHENPIAWKYFESYKEEVTE